MTTSCALDLWSGLQVITMCTKINSANLGILWEYPLFMDTRQKSRTNTMQQNAIKLDKLMDLYDELLKPKGKTLVSSAVMDLDGLWSQRCQTTPNFTEEMTEDAKSKKRRTSELPILTLMQETGTN